MFYKVGVGGVEHEPLEGMRSSYLYEVATWDNTELWDMPGIVPSHCRLLLPLKDNARLLTGLPVRELLNIMTVSQKRKRMLPMDVSLRQQVHGMHPQLNMVIVSKYALVEKSPGVFC